MNVSNLQHVFVLFLFGCGYLFGLRYWWFFSLAIFAIEIDQALSYAHPWYVWFVQVDTIFDIAAGYAGAWLAREIYKAVGDKL